jgi:TolB-like protein/Flp pilus assembly protein TadD
MGVFGELKRRNVIRVAIAYLVASWLLIEVSSVILPTFLAPDWVLQVLMALAMLGFPIAVFVSWVFEITPEGLKRESEIIRDESITHLTGKRLDVMTIVLVIVGIGFVVLDRTMWRAERPTEPATEAQSTAPVTDSEAAVEPVTAVADARASVAVLPFVNMSGKTDDEYFSDGITEEILNVLAKVEDLKVAARTSTFLYKGKEVSIKEVADALGVAYVLEGSVRRSGETVRITAQLINAADGFHLWSDTFDRQLTDIFAIQDEISLAIAEALQVTLEVGDVGNRTDNVAAFDLYLLGRHHFHQRTKDSLQKARRYFEEAIAIDPEYAPAYVGVADSVQLLLKAPSSYGDLSYTEVSGVANEHLDRALALNPNLSEAYASRGLLLLQDNNNEAAIEQFDRSIQLNPNYAMAHLWRALADQAMGDIQKFKQGTNRAAEIDPMSAIVNTNLSVVDLMFGEPKSALLRADRAVELMPDSGITYNVRGVVHWHQGDLEYLDLGQVALAEAVMTGRLRADFLRSAGRFDEALQWERQVQQEYPDSARLGAMVLAATAAGQYSEAIEIFETAIEDAAYLTDTVLDGDGGSWLYGSMPGNSLALAYASMGRTEVGIIASR